MEGQGRGKDGRERRGLRSAPPPRLIPGTYAYIPSLRMLLVNV